MRTAPAMLLAAVTLASCGRPPMESGIDRTKMDPAVRPQADLYRHMNGAWLAAFQIPADRSNFGAFTRLSDEAEEHLRTIIEEAAAAKDRAPGSVAQKVGDMYASFMDSARIEKMGLDPIREDLAAVQKAGSKSDLVRLTAYYTKVGSGAPFFAFVNQDARKPTEYAIHLYQAGISMPDRDYYLRDDAKFQEFRAKFVAHVGKMLTMAGLPDPAAGARRVMAVETALAKAHWANVENRDRVKTYNKYSLNGLQSLSAPFDWKLVAAEGGWNVDSVLVYQPSYFTAFGALFGSLPLEDWKAYYSWRVLTHWASILGSDFVDEDFAFFSRTLQGVEQNRPRWKRGVEMVEGAMGEMVGRLYVERHFKPEAKERMVRLVDNLKEAYRERINGLTWMGPDTKRKALEKLSRFTAKIGYPDRWKDYAALDIRPDDLVGNARRAAIFEYDRQLAKLGRPIDRTEWLMTPQTVNAYYNPNMNEIVFPAAILQPPFFTMAADDAVNYGGIGAVIGHEMTHGFDDQGRRSDGDGNLTDWWTEKDAQEFEKRAELLVKQYGEFTPIDTLRLNGRLTLGENIADVGGLTIAYHAYRKSLNGAEPPSIDGFTGDQRFFLGWAQVWARKYRDDELRRRIFTDPHSPSEYRTNAVVANMPEFYRAFDVKPEDPLFRAEEQRAQIW